MCTSARWSWGNSKTEETRMGVLRSQKRFQGSGAAGVWWLHSAQVSDKWSHYAFIGTRLLLAPAVLVSWLVSCLYTDVVFLYIEVKVSLLLQERVSTVQLGHFWFRLWSLLVQTLITFGTEETIIMRSIKDAASNVIASLSHWASSLNNRLKVWLNCIIHSSREWWPLDEVHVGENVSESCCPGLPWSPDQLWVGGQVKGSRARWYFLFLENFHTLTCRLWV